MAPSSFSLRIQHGITGGFAPPRPSAIHDLSLTSSSPQNILLASSIRDHGTPSLLARPPKSVPLSTDTNNLLEELQTILHRLPTEKPPASADIYRMDVGIMWQSDDFTWVNAAPQGCGGFESDTVVTEDDRKSFQRAVEIVESLVQRGDAEEVQKD